MTKNVIFATTETVLNIIFFLYLKFQTYSQNNKENSNLNDDLHKMANNNTVSLE